MNLRFWNLDFGLIGRVLILVRTLILLLVCGTWEAIRETRLKHKLGADYEGPLEGWDS